MTLWNGSYPFYPGANACFPFDTTRAVIVTVFLSMLATFIIILPGIPGRRRLLWFLRLVLGLFVGAVILNVQFTRDWERGWVQANTSYKSFSPAQVSADIGLHIGLAGLNVTLRDSQNFGIMELAFCTWLISILLFSMSILLYGGQMLLLTGTLILSSLLLFSTARNSLRCPIQFGPVSMRTDYGESFWLALATGLLCLLLGLAIIILNAVQPQKLKLIFSLDRSSEEEQWEQPWLPAQPSCSAQGGFMVPLGELCPGTATRL
nr:dual oxidase maturation factor 1 [Zonotrichia albicollis]